MDIHGGKGICLGPHNYLARFFQSSPIAITVEGANILTRSLIIFGQGAIRCHRYVLSELRAAQDPDIKQGEKLFDKALFGHIGLILSNIFRSLFLGLTNGRFVKAPVSSPGVGRYYQLLTRCSADFSLLADFSMIVLGSELKRKERLSARLGDILSKMYMMSSVLKRYEEEGRQGTDLPLVQWSCQNALLEIQQQIDGVLQNFPNKAISIILRCLIFPLGKPFVAPSDHLSQQVAEILLSPSATRDRLTHGAFKGNVIGEVESAFLAVIAAEPIEAKIHKAVRNGIIKNQALSALITAAVNADVITAEEHTQLLAANKARQKVIAVDDFAPEELVH
jgi:acyl-CoA dehydrogenase